MPTTEMTQAMPTPANWLTIWPQWPSMAPEARVSGGILEDRVDDAGGEEAGEDRSQGSACAVDAEGVQRVVIAEEALTMKTMKEQKKPAIRPMSRADMGWTKPEAGVMATRPATAPEMAPSAVGLPL